MIFWVRFFSAPLIHPGVKVHPLRRPPDASVRIRPPKRLYWRLLAATLAFVVPVFAVLYPMTIPDGPWPVVTALLAIIVLTLVAATILFARTGLWVSEAGVAERGFFGTLSYVRREEIAHAMLAHTLHGGGTHTVPQLFLVDDGLHQLIRLRGQFWGRDEMLEVCGILRISITELTPAVSARELLSDYPGLMYWFERKPQLAAFVIGSSIFVIAGTLVAALIAAGVARV